MDPKRNPRIEAAGSRGGGSAAGAPSMAAARAAGRGGAAGSGAAGSQSAAGAAASPALTAAIDQLAADLNQLRVDYDRFFAGALAFPPEELRGRVQTQLRSLRNQSGGTTVERFRMADLEARYNSYSELFNRRVRQREEGRRPSPHAPAAGAMDAPRYDPAAGILVGTTVDPAAVAALYAGLHAGEQAGPRFDLATFDTYLRRQAEAIRAKAGCQDVLFRLAAEDGKLKLKARPVGGSGNPRP